MNTRVCACEEYVLCCAVYFPGWEGGGGHAIAPLGETNLPALFVKPQEVHSRNDVGETTRMVGGEWDMECGG